MSPATQTGPDGDSVDAWRAWLRNRVYLWKEAGQSTPRAIIIAWGLGIVEHNKRHGAKPSATCCAGCGKRMNGPKMPDGAMVHPGLDCLAAWGDRWRSEAHEGLVALGLNPPKTVLSSTV
jgi:hypothetical protein